MKVKIFLVIALSIMVPSFVVAGIENVYPRPHRAIEDGEGFLIESVNIRDTSRIDPVALRKVEAMFKIDSSSKYIVSIIEDTQMVDLPPLSGAYQLEVSNEGIFIKAYDGRGSFYALQTLSQLFDAQNQIKLTRINDYPEIEFRGTVEGFYGQPWGFEGRKSQLEFYGKWKMNTYIYGPKDDPYHGFSNRWRDPYPEKEAAAIKQLVDIAHENKVDFVWAVHPGRDIKWDTDKDIDACIKKFEMMYELGVRSFAVFFDDIGGEGARPEMQVKLLNRVNRDFVRKKGDVTPLIMCPTQYNQSWSGGPYLDILGTTLDSDIAVMWTGRSVCTNITQESLEWVNAKIRRKAYIWWNWPVSDYCRTQLLLGTAYGNTLNAKNLVTGFTSNPMDKPEASKIGLFPLADFCWNSASYDSQKSWQMGMKKMYPECAEALIIFAKHNSDQGPNGHGYHREESVEMQAPIESMDAYFNGGKWSQESYEQLLGEYTKMAQSAKHLKHVLKGTALFNEIECWVDAFEALGEAGQNAIISLKYPSEKSLQASLNAFDLMDVAFANQKEKTSADPWSQGCKVSIVHMTPFAKRAFEFAAKKYAENYTGEKIVNNVQSEQFKAFSSAESLKNIQAERDGKFIRVKKILEMIKLEPNQTFGLELPQGVYANYIHMKLDNPKASEKGVLQVSKDGKDWNRAKTKNSGGEMHTDLNVKNKIRFGRYVNTSKEPIEFKIDLFKFDIPNDARVNEPSYASDHNLNTFYTFSTGEHLKIATPNQAEVEVFGNGKYRVEKLNNEVLIIAEGDAKVNDVLIKKRGE